MAINLQNKVTLVISTCLILTTSLIIGHWFVSRNSKDVGAGIEKSSFPEVCFYGFAISAEILGVIGTFKREKWLLVPIILLFSCVITACIGCYLNFITGGNVAITLVLGMLRSDNEHGKDILVALLVISSIFCVTLFSLAYVIEFYKEMINDDIEDEEEKQLLEPLSACSDSPSTSEKKNSNNRNKSGYFIFEN